MALLYSRQRGQDGGVARRARHRPLIAQAGLCPHAYTCGTSVRGQPRLRKLGGGLLRGTLSLCSGSACRTNAPCTARYERLLAKGKHKKLALLAVSNKLLQQAFALVKSGLPYQTDFAQKTVPVT